MLAETDPFLLVLNALRAPEVWLVLLGLHSSPEKNKICRRVMYFSSILFHTLETPNKFALTSYSFLKQRKSLELEISFCSLVAWQRHR